MVLELLISLYGSLVGRPWQRRRADRLIKRGRVRCVLFDGDGSGLAGRSFDGVAEVSERRLRIQDVEVWVRGVEGPPGEGPIGPFARDGRFHPPEGNLAFEPRTLIHTLRPHNGSRVRWAVLAHQGEQALGLLGGGLSDQ